MIGICTATLLTDAMGAGPDDVGVAAAGALDAGFAGASVWAHQLDPVVASGLRIDVVEAAMGWANGDAEATRAEAEHLAGLARRHGATKVVAVCMEPTIADLGAARRNLATLVETVAAAGAQVCVEFLPWSAIPDLATAWSLVEPLGPSAGVLLDTWHWVRQPGGPAFDLLTSIPGERIGYVQLCDAAPEPTGDLLTEAMTARLLPGEGTVDFAAVHAALAEVGATPYVATEVFNPALVEEQGAAGAAMAMRDAAEQVWPALPDR